MAGDISNKTLAILAGIAIVVSVVGLFIKGAPLGVTGLVPNANETGTVKGVVTANVQVNLTDELIDFGNVQNEEEVDSYFDDSDWLTVENIGQSAIEVDFWSKYALFYDKYNTSGKSCNGNQSATSNCRAYAARNISDDSYNFSVMNASAGGILCLMDTYEGYNKVPVYGDDGTSAPQVADSMATGETFNITIRINVPKYEESGAVNTSVYVSATEDTDGVDASCA